MSALDITLEYSTDNGANWTAETFVCHLYEFDLKPELHAENQLSEQGRIVQTWKVRGVANLFLDVDNFLTGTKWHWLVRLYEKPLVRLSHDPTAAPDGVTLWQSATNTNYVVFDGPPDRIFKNNEWRSSRVKLKTRDWV